MDEVCQPGKSLCLKFHPLGNVIHDHQPAHDLKLARDQGAMARSQ